MHVSCFCNEYATLVPFWMTHSVMEGPVPPVWVSQAVAVVQHVTLDYGLSLRLELFWFLQ